MLGMRPHLVKGQRTEPALGSAICFSSTVITEPIFPVHNDIAEAVSKRCAFCITESERHYEGKRSEDLIARKQREQFAICREQICLGEIGVVMRGDAIRKTPLAFTIERNNEQPRHQTTSVVNASNPTSVAAALGRNKGPSSPPITKLEGRFLIKCQPVALKRSRMSSYVV